MGDAVPAGAGDVAATAGAVDPVWQRRGVGTTLMASTLADADRRGLPAYLETTTEANVAYYGRVGFAVVRDAVPDTAGPRTWLMLREPA